MGKRAKILVVDDEPFNLDILHDYLSADGYEVIVAEDGLVALNKLKEHLDVGLIVLDRMMPNMDGMDVLKRVKADHRFTRIPVIMQTAAAQSTQILQGIEAGVYYYLTKPYDDNTLLSIVNAALLDANNKEQTFDDLRLNKRVLGMMENARFHFRTLDEARNLASFVANSFPEPEAAVYGLSELFINAVEHGNLGITYEEKTQLILHNTWYSEIERRLMLPENQNKYAVFTFDIVDNRIKVWLKDQGTGFDFAKYLELSPERCVESHGRGIALAKMISFDTLDYIGCGNEVICSVMLPKHTGA